MSRKIGPLLLTTVVLAGLSAGAVPAPACERHAHATATVRATDPTTHTDDDPLARIRERAHQISEEQRATGEDQLDRLARRTNKHASAHGDAVIGARLAAEFGVRVDELATERTQLGVSWGELMIAHTLRANAEADVTVRQIVRLHAQGWQWLEIAAGLELETGQVIDAVRAEARVAAGEVPPDGEVAMIAERSSES